MDGKRSRGRQKIAIRRISKQSDCFATFSKRKLGLFKKASELSTLCSVDIGIFVYSPTGKPYSFFHPTMESVVGRIRNPGWPSGDDVSRLIEGCARTRVRQLSQMLEGLAGQLQAQEAREKQLDEEIGGTGGGCGRCWWDEPVDELSREEAEEMRMWLEGLKSQLGEELKIRSFERQLHA